MPAVLQGIQWTSWLKLQLLNATTWICVVFLDYWVNWSSPVIHSAGPLVSLLAFISILIILSFFKIRILIVVPLPPLSFRVLKDTLLLKNRLEVIDEEFPGSKSSQWLQLQKCYFWSSEKADAVTRSGSSGYQCETTGGGWGSSLITGLVITALAPPVHISQVSLSKILNPGALFSFLIKVQYKCILLSL